MANIHYYVHEECAEIVQFIKGTKCDVDVNASDCLDNHIHQYVMVRERDYRKQLAVDVLRMFPWISRGMIQETLDEIPLHINACFAILKGICSNSTSLICPAYQLPILNMSLDTDPNTVNILEEIHVNLNGDVCSNISPHLSPDINKEFTVNEQVDFDTFDEAGPSGYGDNQVNTFHIKGNQINSAVILHQISSEEEIDLTSSQETEFYTKAEKRKSKETNMNGPSSPKRSFNEIIPTNVNTVLEQKLINTLTEIFPDCKICFIKELCRGKEFSPQMTYNLTEELLALDYPKKEQENNGINFDEQLEIMRNVLPDADPEFLAFELDKLSSLDEFKQFLGQLLESCKYPKLVDAERKRRMYAQIRQYTTEFNAEEFLNTIPDPVTFFSRENFRAGEVNIHSDSYYHMNFFLRNYFHRLSVKKIASVLRKSATFLDAVAALEICLQSNDGTIISKRRPLEGGNCCDIPLLQLFAYIEHRNEIQQTEKDMQHMAEVRKRKAIADKKVNTCACCFDDEVMPEDTYACPNGCLACKECIERSASINFAENNLQFHCLSDCGAHFSLETLQACLTPKIFCKIAKRKQLEEVRAAGIEDLEVCPFCDFAAIPAATDRIFKCFNPECMKETCRLCKEPSHIPLRCEEVEKDVDVQQRVFIENQMSEALMHKCWKCGLRYIKADGCNKISCQCGATQCYICRKSNVTYDHFNGQGASDPKKCPLYSNTELLHEQAAIDSGLKAKQHLGISAMKVDPLADANLRIDNAIKNYKKLPGEN